MSKTVTHIFQHICRLSPVEIMTDMSGDEEFEFGTVTANFKMNLNSKDYVKVMLTIMDHKSVIHIDNIPDDYSELDIRGLKHLIEEKIKRYD